MVKVIRTNLGTGESTRHAGYDGIGLSTAIGLLEYWAAEEAKESRITFRSADRKLDDGTIEYARILTDHEETDVVKYHLVFD